MPASEDREAVSGPSREVCWFSIDPVRHPALFDGSFGRHRPTGGRGRLLKPQLVSKTRSGCIVPRFIPHSRGSATQKRKLARETNQPRPLQARCVPRPKQSLMLRSNFRVATLTRTAYARQTHFRVRSASIRRTFSRSYYCSTSPSFRLP